MFHKKGKKEGKGGEGRGGEGREGKGREGRKEGRKTDLTLIMINVRMNLFFILVTSRVCFKIIQEERGRGQQSIYEEYKLKQAQLWVGNY